MALTVTIDKKTIQGNKRTHRSSVTFDSSYPRGGEAFTASDVGMNRLDMVFPTPQGNMSFEWDETNAKLKALDTVPVLIEEEALTVATNVGTLAYNPLYIVAVQSTAGTTTGAFNVIPTGETPLTKQVAVNFTTGVMTFLSTDAVTAAVITYIPQQASGPLSEATLVVDEEVTAAAAKVALTNRAMAVQYVWDDTDSIITSLEPVGEAPSATHTAVVDIDDSSSTKIDSHADDEGNTLKVTYLRYDKFPAGSSIGDADVAVAEDYGFLETLHYRALVIPGAGTQIIGEVSGDANAAATWENAISGTAADGVATWTPSKNYVLTNNTTAFVTSAIQWFLIDPLVIKPGVGEAMNGTDLSEITAEIIAMGI